MNYSLTTCFIAFVCSINITRSSFSSFDISPVTTVINGTQTYITTNDYTSGSITIYWYINNTPVYEVFGSLVLLPVVTQYNSTFNEFLSLNVQSLPGDVVMTLHVILSSHMNNATLAVEDSDGFTLPNVTIIASECSSSQEVVADVTQVPCGLGCIATLSCIDDYEGCPVTATCQNDATWSESIVCEAVTCSLPQQADCGCATSCQFTGSDLRFGESINMTCPDGCSGNSTAVCGANKLLNVTNPCQPVVCYLNEYLPCKSDCEEDCKYDNSPATIQYNELVNLTCPVGCNGFAVARCQKEGIVVVSSYCTSGKVSTCKNCSALPDWLWAILIVGLFIVGCFTGHFWNWKCIWEAIKKCLMAIWSGIKAVIDFIMKHLKCCCCCCCCCPCSDEPVKTDIELET